MNVRFPPPLGIVAWLPTNVLTVTEDSSDNRGNVRRVPPRPMGMPGGAGGASSIASGLTTERQRREQGMARFGQRSGLQAGLGGTRGSSPATAVNGRGTSPATAVTGLRGTSPATPTDGQAL